MKQAIVDLKFIQALLLQQILSEKKKRAYLDRVLDWTLSSDVDSALCNGFNPL